MLSTQHGVGDKDEGEYHHPEGGAAHSQETHYLARGDNLGGNYGYPGNYYQYRRGESHAPVILLPDKLGEGVEGVLPDLLREEYHALNVAYFGPDAIIDEEIDIEWARIPHFYYNFYVYQYATGISAALTLANKVLDGDDTDRDAYLSFLKGGCSAYPVDLLAQAGADIRSGEPFRVLFSRFRELVGGQA